MSDASANLLAIPARSPLFVTNANTARSLHQDVPSRNPQSGSPTAVTLPLLCQAVADHIHEQIQGQATSASAVYPDPLVDGLVHFVAEVDSLSCVPVPRSVRYLRVPPSFELERQPTVDTSTWTTYFVDIDRTTNSWRQLLSAVEASTRPSPTASWEVAAQSAFFGRFQDLTPWTLQRIQATRMPKAHRAPYDLPWTRRGACLLYNDGTLHLETDDRRRLAYPRLRFPKPVVFALFWFGVAPSDEPQPEVREDLPDPQGEAVPLPEPRVSSTHDEIAFEDLSQARCPLDIRRTVARVHINLGHPSREDLVRHLQAAGAPTTAVIGPRVFDAQSARGTRPVKPRPSDIPLSPHSFGEKLLCDVFYMVDSAGTNFQCF